MFLRLFAATTESAGTRGVPNKRCRLNVGVTHVTTHDTIRIPDVKIALPVGRQYLRTFRVANTVQAIHVCSQCTYVLVHMGIEAWGGT